MLLRQESTTYEVADYIGNASPRFEASDGSCFSGNRSPESPPKPRINPLWREQICDWSYNIVDHFDLDRETVSVSFSYLDRFVSRYHNQLNHKTYQLAAMTTLYMAIKLYEMRKVGINAFISLSRGHFTASHVLAMENIILQTLSWRVHPPTPLSFVNHLLLLFPAANTRLNDIARFMTELSVCDYFFVARRPSHVAVACILNAMEDVQVPPHMILDYLEAIKATANIDVEGRDIYECQAQLKEMYTASGCGNNVQDFCAEPPVERDESVSPVCVSKMIA